MFNICIIAESVFLDLRKSTCNQNILSKKTTKFFQEKQNISFWLHLHDYQRAVPLF